MQDHFTLKDYTKANMGSPWPTRVFIGHCHESWLMSKCVHNINSQIPHCGHFGIPPSQLSDTENILYGPTPNLISRHEWCFEAPPSRCSFFHNRRWHYHCAHKISGNIHKKINNPPVQATTTAPKATEVKHPEALVQPLLMSLVKHKHQTRLQTKNNTSDLDNVIEYQNSPQPPGVVTLATIGAEPLRFPERERNLSPRNLFHAYFLDKVSANQAISLGKKHWTNMQIMNAVLYISTGK